MVKGLSEADSLLGVVGAACAAGVVDSPEGGLEGAADAGEGTTGRESSPSPNDGGIPVRRYSTALSGLLQLARNAAITYQLRDETMNVKYRISDA